MKRFSKIFIPEAQQILFHHVHYLIVLIIQLDSNILKHYLYLWSKL